MIRNSWLVAFIVFVILAITVYTFFSGGDDEVYIEQILNERKDKFRFLKYNADSPFSEELKAQVKELPYFPIDSKYKVRARLELITDDRMIVIPTSDGKEERYLKFAYAHFELDGQKQRLLILQPMMRQFQNKLSIIFTDGTSGKESYGACRYLELTKEGDQTITIDFNRAYNPFCAYNEHFSCPLPPTGNHVTVEIRAGEMDFPYH